MFHDGVGDADGGKLFIIMGIPQKLTPTEDKLLSKRELESVSLEILIERM